MVRIREKIVFYRLRKAIKNNNIKIVKKIFEDIVRQELLAVLPEDIIIQIIKIYSKNNHILPDVIRNNENLLIKILDMPKIFENNTFLILFDEKLYDNINVINKLISNSEYNISICTPKVLFKNEYFVKNMMEKYVEEFNFNMCKNLIEFCMNAGITEKVIIDSLKNALNITIKKMKNDDVVFPKKITDFINDLANDPLTKEILSDEIINLIITGGYRMDRYTPHLIKNNCDYVKKINELGNLIDSKGMIYEFLGDLVGQIRTASYDEITKFIHSCDEKKLTDEVIDAVLSRGFFLKTNTSKLIVQNANFFNKMKKHFIHPGVLLSFISNIDETFLTQDVLETILFSKEFLNIWTNIPCERKEIFIRILSSDFAMLEKMLSTSKENNNSLISLLSALSKNNFEKVMFYIEKYKLNNINIYTDISLFDINGKEFFQNYFEELSNELDSEYIHNIALARRQLNSNFCVSLELNNLFKKECFDVFSVVELCAIYKYLFLIDKRIDFNMIIANNELYKFREGYNLLYGNFDVENLYDYYLKYLRYSKMINSIDFSSITSNKLLLLKRLFNSKYEFDISILELENINEYLFDYNTKNMYDLDSLKNTISFLIFNRDYKEFEYFNSHILSSEKALRLAYYIKNKDVKFILEKFSIILKFFEEKVVNNNDYNSLLEIAMNLNELFLKQNEVFDNLFSFLDNMEKNIYIFYGMELNELLAEDVSDTKGIKYSKNMFFSNNDGNNKMSVDYIEYFEDKVFLQHIMNAFGNEGKITDWKKPRLIGKTYLCLSLNSNNMENLIDKPIDIDHVTLLFDKIEPDKLKAFSSFDLGTTGSLNSQKLDFVFQVNCDCSRIMLKTITKNSHSEYVVLRENTDGSIMYPCGVKVIGDKPLQAEIDAAAYLGVPLIKLHKTKKKNMSRLKDVISFGNKYRFGINQERELRDFAREIYGVLGEKAHGSKHKR